MAQKLDTIGADMASGRLQKTLLAEHAGAYDITLFGAEPCGNYNRIMLSPVLAGEAEFADIVSHDAAWFAGHGIETRFGVPVVKSDPRGKRVIATGPTSFLIPVEGNHLPGVVGFRNIVDVDAMLEAAKGRGRAVMIGDGRVEAVLLEGGVTLLADLVVMAAGLVSGCPRNCAEATFKDLGVICVESATLFRWRGRDADAVCARGYVQLGGVNWCGGGLYVNAGDGQDPCYVDADYAVLLHEV